MRTIAFIPILLTEKADVFSIRFSDDASSEFEKFYICYKDTEDPFLRSDLNRILATIQTIGLKGALENETRPEGNIRDRICAIPLLTEPRSKQKHGTLRLYCIRVSSKLFILGGGGLKTTQTYEEDSRLAEQVSLLTLIDKELSALEFEGKDLTREIYNLTLDIE